jgi:hypothetical protein
LAADFTNDSKRCQASGSNSSLGKSGGFLGEGLDMAKPDDSRIGKILTTIVDLAQQGFKSIDGAEPKHYAAIGRFLVAVGTHIDAPLNVQLEVQLGSVELDTARALIGEMRTQDVMSGLRRIVAGRRGTEDAVKEIDALFREISVLRATRDVVAHRACMVGDDRLAFHNVTVAKAIDAMKVEIYTLTELEEFSQYAKRLGFRIKQLFAAQRPIEPNPAARAFLDYTVYGMALQLAVALMEGGKVPRAKLEHLRAAQTKAGDAMKLYTDAARAIDQNFAALRKTSMEMGAEFLTAISLLQAPDNQALREIPARLRKPDSDRRQRKSRSPKRPPESSGA